MSRYPAYPEYKDSGVKWLGEIPAHWEVKKGRYLGNIWGFYEIDTTQITDSGQIMYAKVDDLNSLQDGFYLRSTSAYVNLDPKWLKMPQGEFLLFPKRGAAIFTNKVGIANSPILFDSNIMAWCINPSNETKYVAYTLLARGLSDLADVSSIPQINNKHIYPAKFPFPPLPEQRAIAAFLDRETTRLDTLIAKKRRLIELLQEQRVALISHAVTKGLDPTTPMKDSGVEWLGEIPAHWEVKRLKFLAEIRTGTAKGRKFGNRKTAELPYLRVANVQDGYLDLADVATITVGVDEIERYLLKEGDVLMNEGGDFDKLGRGYVWHNEIHNCIHQNHVFAVRPRLGVNPYWLNTITQTDYAKFYFILKSKQSTNLASISSFNLKHLPVLLPPKPEQDEILEFVRQDTARIDALVGKVQAAMERLEEYRTALISAAVTGKIDVRGESVRSEGFSPPKSPKGLTTNQAGSS